LFKLSSSLREIVIKKGKELKKNVQNALFSEKKEKQEISTSHFFGMSISSVLSTCIYLYFIMDLGVKLFFREHPLLVTIGVVRGKDDDDNPTREEKLLSDLGMDNVPAIYTLSMVSQYLKPGQDSHCCK
jgi:hypothetical protein